MCRCVRWVGRLAIGSSPAYILTGGAVPSGLGRRPATGRSMVRVPLLSKLFASELWQFRLPRLPVSFGRDSKSRWSLLSGVYARGSKRSHQSALECVTVSQDCYVFSFILHWRNVDIYIFGKLRHS